MKEAFTEQFGERGSWRRGGGAEHPFGGRRGHRGAAMAGRRGGRGFGGGPWGPFGPPFGPGFGGPRGWRGGPKARRGDVRSAILSVLSEESLNGYQIIQQIEQRSQGGWKPSPGSVYPTLAQLQDEGLVTADAEEGRRTFSLTDDGRSYVGEHGDELNETWSIWDESEGSDSQDLRPLLGQVAAALHQVVAVGTPAQQDQAREAMADLRKRLYAILGED